ncbi:MAG: YggS family pyridoxal phosphate enzyme, partial [Betaproteobacteria bacterium]|nr:YggS family pyridoxal phosphate enzyme [Betaproteobacteria bacterium]
MLDRIATVRAELAAAALAAGRDPADITLIAVSKTFPAEAIRDAYAAGLRHFGENYVQEACDKIDQLRNLDGAVWHFIGPLQS